MTIEADVEKLLTYGQMALEQGWHSKAREYFEQVLAVDATNQEAVDGLARVNEILSRRMPTPVEPKRAESAQPSRKVSLEPTRPEVEPAKPKPGVKLAAMWKGKGHWLILAVIPVVLLVLAVAYQRIVPVAHPAPTATLVLTPIPTLTLVPTPKPTATQTLAEYCKSVISYEKAAASLVEEANLIPIEGDALFIVQRRQQVLEKWRALSPPDVAKRFHDAMVVSAEHHYYMVKAIMEGDRDLVTYHAQQTRYYWDQAANSINDLLYVVAKCESYLNQQ